ncbi:isochorismatase family protein [Paraburkholderia sp. CNPSo 3281]|uniref:isochorismatase family protein n=1 Tax=Paraburkholderia sp. CNPSo 3281 TaxID=2940933 RepID=UPI0020B80077|nr:isochorismatase family protein [Paraburkholderia sp. CNPSo 3281]MCP3718270.1 isochorismatase family protein [Paraburkholderia sp. CNPSo 3281]
MTTALLVIDFQKELIDTEPLPGDIAMISANINALMQRARHAGAPVVLIQHEDDTALVCGSDAWALSATLATELRDHLIGKRTPDSFLGTGLAALLAAHAVKHVVICGYASEFCVDTTVRRAAANGLTVTLAADAHTTHDKPHANAALIRAHHNATLSNMRSFGPKISAVRTAEIAFDPAA